MVVTIRGSYHYWGDKRLELLSLANLEKGLTLWSWVHYFREGAQCVVTCILRIMEKLTLEPTAAGGTSCHCQREEPLLGFYRKRGAVLLPSSALC